MDGVVFEILSEVKNEPSEFGLKPKCSIKVTNGIESYARKWTLNQQNVNFCVDKFGKDSMNWIGKKLQAYTEVIKGNVSIRVREA